MCGIGGYYAFKRVPAFEELKGSMESMNHRGPDAEGFFVEEKVGFGHKRLSIIDTSISANQPYFSADGNYVIIFNGEIYNFKEIAIELNLSTRTSSDTEVLVEAFVKLGESFANKLNGMFSFAIYSRLDKKMWLFRDRIGIKPLYYYFDEDAFIFSSEIKALWNYKSIQSHKGLNIKSISDYLHLGYIPEPETIFSGIHQLKSGHFAVIGSDGLQEVKYWDSLDCISSDVMMNESIALKELDELIRTSIEYRLICDVPFGTFLSGGIDSSLVTAVASKLFPHQLKTFSLGFTDASYDESVYSEKIAKYLNTEHYNYRLTENDALALVDTAIRLFDQPFSDSSSIPTLLVSKMASKEVKMVLTGDGGDELFMGYGAYKWAQRLNNPVWEKIRKLLSFFLQNGNSKYKRVAQLLNYSHNENLNTHIFSQEQCLFSKNEIIDLIKPLEYSTVISTNNYFNDRRKLSASEIQAFFDLNYYLKDDLLVKVDRTSMFESLECRVPLLDYRIVEWSLNLDPRLKIKGNVSKYLLKKILYLYLPEEYFNRPKQGFSVPLGKWLKGPLSYLIDECLSEENINATGILNFPVIKELITKFRSGNFDYLYNRIWSLVVLQKTLINHHKKLLF